MIHEHRFSVDVAVDTDTGQVTGMSIAEEETDDKVWTGEEWLPLDEQSPWWEHDQTATAHLAAALVPRVDDCEALIKRMLDVAADDEADVLDDLLVTCGYWSRCEVCGGYVKTGDVCDEGHPT